MADIETTASPEFVAEQLGEELDVLYDKISAIVCEVGPKLLTRGMPALEANTAILECLTRLKNRLDLAITIIDKSFEWVEEYEDSSRLSDAKGELVKLREN